MNKNLVRYSCLIKKKVVITGGATGIGSVIVKLLWARCAIILDIQESEANKLIKLIPETKNLLQPNLFIVI